MTFVENGANKFFFWVTAVLLAAFIIILNQKLAKYKHIFIYEKKHALIPHQKTRRLPVFIGPFVVHPGGLYLKRDLRVAA